MINDNEDRPRHGDYRKDDEKPQIVQLNANDLSKEEVDIEIAKAKEGSRNHPLIRKILFPFVFVVEEEKNVLIQLVVYYFENQKKNLMKVMLLRQLLNLILLKWHQIKQ